MKKLLLLSFVLLNVYQAKSQTYYYYSETKYTYGPYYFDQSMGLIKDMLEEKKHARLRAEYLEKMKGKTKQMRDYYKTLGEYPGIIPNGWHNVSIVVGNDFIDSRKVKVENNKIIKVVWDNWMEEEITFSGPIKKGKSAIQFAKPTEMTGGLVEVFFMNSITDPTSTASLPLKPAVITFWTGSDKYRVMSIEIEGQKFENFIQKFDKKVECGELNAVNVYVKPGQYQYKARVFSAVWKQEKIKLNEGECKVVQIARGNDRIDETPDSLKTASITFWTKSNKYNTMSVKVDGKRNVRFTQKFENVECGELNAITVKVKPGIHSYKGFASGMSPIVEKKVSLEKGECRTIEIIKRLNKKEKKDLKKAERKRLREERRLGL